MIELLLLVLSVVFFAFLLGEYLFFVYLADKKTFLSNWLGSVERFCYRVLGVDEKQEMTWGEYAKNLIYFNLAGFLFLFLLQIFQNHLPLNPAHLASVPWDLAVNTAISFVTNTNWQSYGGESTMSYLTQMCGMTTQNFVSAAVGMAACAALVRGFVRDTTQKIGNFWVDLTRSILYVLLPLAFLASFVLISQGVVQTFRPYATAQTLEGAKQVIAIGPAASQIAIKQLGSNGGGFFNANSAHPFENPTPFSNFFELFGVLWLPAAFPFFLGASLGKRREGRALFIAMMFLLLLGIGVSLCSEFQGNPVLQKIGVQGGMNLEGKEVRFGVTPSVAWSVFTTATSNGSVNAMHDSLTPISGLVAMFNIIVGEVIFGGVGVGLMGIIFYAVVALFLVGLMIGRTPELYGKKLEAFEMGMSALAILLPSFALLVGVALAVSFPFGLSSLNNQGPHGFSEIFYAFASAAGNNGSAFAGLNSNTLFYNLGLGLVMIIGRFGTIIPGLAIAGSLARKKIAPESRATLPTSSFMFIVMLVGAILIVGALTFLPAFTIGPVLEHLALLAGKGF